MSQSEQTIAFAMLVGAGFTRPQATWMSASCPSIKRCREVCGEFRRRAK
jgi:hypothetical protein